MKMKQISFKITIFFALIVALLGCAKENAIHNGAHQGTEFTLRLVQTKTVNDGYATEWVKGDRVNVFHAEEGTSNFICDGPFEFTGEDSFTGFIREDALVNGLVNLSALARHLKPEIEKHIDKKRPFPQIKKNVSVFCIKYRKLRKLFYFPLSAQNE